MSHNHTRKPVTATQRRSHAIATHDARPAPAPQTAFTARNRGSDAASRGISAEGAGHRSHPSWNARASFGSRSFFTSHPAVGVPDSAASRNR